MLSSWLFLLLLLIPTWGDEREFFSMVFAYEKAIVEASVAKNFAQECVKEAFFPLFDFEE